LEEFDRAMFQSRASHNERSIQQHQQQYGGTSVTSIGKLAHYSMGAGQDKKKLGRWTWSRYRGKQGQVLRVVSLYRPNPNSAQGELTVWAQQKQYLLSINDDRDPRDAFLQDLSAELQAWLNMGDHIVLAGDLNDHILDAHITSLFDDLGLVNLIFTRHPTGQCPATYWRNTQHKVVDGMWATPGVQATRCGYLAPLDFPGDHAVPWADITFSSVLGHNPPHPSRPAARRLRLFDDRSVAKYLQTYHRLISEQHLPTR